MRGTFVNIGAGGALHLVSNGACARATAVDSAANERCHTCLGDTVDDAIGAACAVTVAVGARPFLADLIGSTWVTLK
jgi:hypothetical protein